MLMIINEDENAIKDEIKKTHKSPEYENIIQNIAVAAIPVIACGRTTLKNAWSLEYPSIIAASSYSLGISSIKPFNSQTAKLKFTTVYNIIIPRWVSPNPIFLYIINIGTATAMGGNILVESIKNNKSSFKGTLNRENA